MKKIFKYAVPIDGMMILPEGTKVLTVQMQDGIMVLWAEVDPGASKRGKIFYLCQTGDDVPEYGNYISTTVSPGGIVWHIYEKRFFAKDAE